MAKFPDIFWHIIPHLSYIIARESRNSIGNFLRYNYFLPQVSFKWFCCRQLMSEKCQNWRFLLRCWLMSHDWKSCDIYKRIDLGLDGISAIGRGSQGLNSNKTIWMFGSFGLCIEYIFWLNGYNSGNILTYNTLSQLYNKSRI